MFFQRDVVGRDFFPSGAPRTRGPCDEIDWISGYLFRGAMSAWVRTGKELWCVARQAEGEGPRERVDAAQPRPPPSSETEPGRHPTDQRPNQRTSEPANRRTSEPVEGVDACARPGRSPRRCLSTAALDRRASLPSLSSLSSLSSRWSAGSFTRTLPRRLQSVVNPRPSWLFPLSGLTHRVFQVQALARPKFLRSPS